MSKKIFVSYNHRQGEWVWANLVPILRAGGAQVLIDRERFEAGKALIHQMDATQDDADLNLLILSPEYMQSDYCLHEMDRAIDRDPKFVNGIVLPIVRCKCDLPTRIQEQNPLYADLRDDELDAPWQLLLSACDVDIGVSPPRWLDTRETLRRFLSRNQSVNLVVRGRRVLWRPLLEALASEFSDMARVELHNPVTVSRRGLVEEILRACGTVRNVPPEPEDLVVLGQTLSERDKTRLALTNFDPAADRDSYGFDFFAALCYHVNQSRKMVLLIQSHRPFTELVPRVHPLSAIDLKIVEIRGKD